MPETSQRNAIKKKKYFYLTALLAALANPSLAYDRLSLGLSQDNLNLTIRSLPRLAYHTRFGFVPPADVQGAGVLFLGFGLRWYIGEGRSLGFYLFAPDLNLSYFDVDQAQGVGVATGGGAGLEYRLLKRVSLTFDFGPYWIYLRNIDPKLTRQSLDFVINTSINFYLK